MSTQNPIDLLTERGFVQDITDLEGLRETFDNGPVTFYYGMDPTAPSLHAGNLIGLMAMSWLQRLGHRPIGVAGGGTGRIGDPTGRDDERQVLDDATLAKNLEGIKKQASAFIDFDNGGVLFDNYEWLKTLGFMAMLSEVGPYVSVNQMISRESVKRRLENREQGITFTEFTYQLVQAYDFAHLFHTEGCVLQLGGSDQWGNITAGTDLIRRKYNGSAYGLVWPLLTTASGAKFGKSAGNAVWLSAELTTPYAYYQYWINSADEDVERYLKLFTFLELDRITEVMVEHAEAPFKRTAQKLLAAEATRIIHGDEGVSEAQNATAVLFGKEPFAGLSDEVLNDAFAGAPSATLAAEVTNGGTTVAEVMTTLGGASSVSEARRLVKGGGVRINNVVVDDASRPIADTDFSTETTLILRIGKKRYFIGRRSLD